MLCRGDSNVGGLYIVHEKARICPAIRSKGDIKKKKRCLAEMAGTSPSTLGLHNGILLYALDFHAFWNGMCQRIREVKWWAMKYGPRY
ncbi:hypothetical protein J6590_017119 [Homalodisca vitripennis]|nr:hypothetical protein J6590_017119 [Homalodisca vitripennis]